MTRRSFCDSTCFSWSIPELLCTPSPLRNWGCCRLEKFYQPFRNGKDRTWNGVERWNIFWNAFQNVGTLLERFLERVPERFGTYLERVPECWNALTLTFLVDTWKVWNVFRMYLESSERFWNVPGTRVPRVPEHLFQNAQAFRNAAERTWNGEERCNGI